MSGSEEQKQGVFWKTSSRTEDIDSRYSVSYQYMLSGLRMIHVQVKRRRMNKKNYDIGLIDWSNMRQTLECEKN